MTGPLLRVLFVDDEAHLLDGLRRAMRIYDVSWNMAFALGGDDALAQLATDPADVVVSDIRMPGMDGSALLTLVARDYPRTIRLVLSGRSDTGAARRALLVAHQFLAKPIAPSVLAETFTRLADVRALLEDTALRTRANAAGMLPASPRPYADVNRLCADDGASVTHLAEAIARDPAMTAKVFQLASSAFFGPSVRARGIAAAVGYVGFDGLRAIVAGRELAISGSLDSTVTRAVAALQRHSFIVAHIARRIAPDPRLADAAYSAGLLHDVGKLLLLDLPAAGATTHAAIGGYLLGIWGLPKEIVAAVAAHHEPNRIAGGNLLAGVIHAADALAHEHSGEETNQAPAVPFDVSALAAVGMTNAMHDWRVIAAEEIAGLESSVK